MNVLITGASGLLGREVFQAFQDPGWTLSGTAFRRAAPGLLPCDFSRTETIAPLLNQTLPDIIIHAAAERHPDAMGQNPEASFRLNVKAPEAIARWVAERDAFLIYLSTDYVFDGTKPPYAPDDRPHPLNDYGISKLAGEIAVRREAPANAAILRVPILYGPCETLAESAVTVLAANMKGASGPLKMDDWATRYPTLTTDVAAVLLQMVRRRLADPDFSGTYHWSGAEPMTKFGMARCMAPFVGFDPARLVPDPNPPAGAPRPRDAHLDSSALEALGFGNRRTPFREAIKRIIATAGTR